jgi:hypothetical protein
MADELKPTQPFSLRRWSRRKHAAARDERLPSPAAPPAHGAPARADDAVLRENGASAPAPLTGAPPAPIPAHESPALPPVDSLTFESDFTPFMRKDVDDGVRRSALRKLLRDPRFNVMDGLDVDIDDYSKPSPIEPELVRTLAQARYLFDPPKTRVNAEGHVEDVPDEPARAGTEAEGDGAQLPQRADATAGAAALPPPADAVPAPSPDRVASDGTSANTESER